MGVNDDRLSPREHDEMRGRLTQGAARIHPVGKHRRQWTAALVAVALIAGIGAVSITVASLLGTGTPDPVTTPTPTVAPTPTATGTSTPTPTETTSTQARAPFDGDCAGLLDAGRISEVTGGNATAKADEALHTGLLGDSASAALLGGLSCVWGVEGGIAAELTVSVFPVAVVPDQVLADGRQFGCWGWGYCGIAREQSGTWVRVDLARNDVMSDVSAEEEAALTAVADAVFTEAFSHPAAELSGVPAPADPDRWNLDCAALLPTVEGVFGTTQLTPGFQTDSFPQGPVWDVLTAGEIAAWCPWYHSSGTGEVQTEIDIRLGVAAPDPDLLAQRGYHPMEFGGVDAAYRSDELNGAGPGVLLVADGNVLLVRHTDAETMAAAVLATLRG
jgi:hypothetical protein